MWASGSTRRRLKAALASALLALAGTGAGAGLWAGGAAAFDAPQPPSEPPAAERLAQRAPAARPPGGSGGANAPFDYYVLALSWSPAYCADEARNPDEEPQCAPRRRYGFVVHGLWPQHEKGWPEFCGDPGWVQAETLASVDGILPSRRLAVHQWRKHGTCSGLDPEGYFSTLREAWADVKINEIFGRIDRELQVAPKVVEEAFLEANPAYEADGVTVVCRGGLLREVRVCLDRNLDPRACAPDARRDCSARSIRLPPLR